MKKLFQNIVDRVHAIWVILTRKNFALFAYHKIENYKSVGAAAVITDNANSKDNWIFFDTIRDYSQKIKDEAIKDTNGK